MVFRRFGRGVATVVSSGGTGTPIGDNLHPRLWFAAADVAGMKSRLAGTAKVKRQFQRVVDAIDSNVMNGFPLSGTTSEDAAYCGLIAQTWQVTGITYVHTLAEYKQKAIDLMLARAAASVVDSSGGTYEWTVTLAFDWLFNDLGSTDKATIATWMITSWDSPYQTDGAWNSVYGGSIPGMKLMVALAVKGMGGAYDTFADAVIASYHADFRDAATGRIYAQSYAVGAHVGLSTSVSESTEGGSGQGWLYWAAVGPYGTIHHMLGAEEAYRTAYGITRAVHYDDTALNVLRYYPRMLADMDYGFVTPCATSYTTVDSKSHHMYKDPASSAGQYYSNRHEMYILAALANCYGTVDATQAGHAQWLMDNYVGDAKYPFAMASGLYYFVAGNEVSSVDPTAGGIGLSVQRGDGQWVFRTGWQTTSNNHARVSLQIPKWMTNVDGTYQLILGFDISRKGPQVIRQGLYGHDGGGGRSYGTNMMIFPDNTLVYTDTGTSQNGVGPHTDGGYRWGDGSTPLNASALVENGAFDLRGTTLQKLYAGDDAADYDYVSADITRAYDTTTIAEGGSTYGRPVSEPKRLASYVREHVSFRPGTPDPNADPVWLVVVDRATTFGTQFEKRWLFHPSTRATITGTTATPPSRGATGQDGKLKWTGVTGFKWDNTTSFHYGSTAATVMNGTGFLTTLAPSSFTVIEVGGPNASNGLSWRGPEASVDDTTHSHEYEGPYGRNGSNTGSPGSPEGVATGMTAFVGAYKYEISPVSASLQDTFCHVIEVANNGATKSAVTDGGTSTFVAGIIDGASYDRAFAIGKLANNLSAGTFILAAVTTGKLFVGSLTPSTTRTLTPGSNVKLNGASAGVAYTATTSSAGNLYVSYQVTGAGTGAANLVTVS